MFFSDSFHLSDINITIALILLTHTFKFILTFNLSRYSEYSVPHIQNLFSILTNNAHKILKINKCSYVLPKARLDLKATIWTWHFGVNNCESVFSFDRIFINFSNLCLQQQFHATESYIFLEFFTDVFIYTYPNFAQVEIHPILSSAWFFFFLSQKNLNEEK